MILVIVAAIVVFVLVALLFVYALCRAAAIPTPPMRRVGGDGDD